jgi:hypothetical protein
VTDRTFLNLIACAAPRCLHSALMWRSTAIVRIVTLALVGFASGPLRAQNHEARALYEQGRAAFEHQNYSTAYEAFRRSYSLSKEPALLFDMASALQKLNRPRDGAEELRAYLRVRPTDEDRAAIEERIRALDEEQRLLEREHAVRAVPMARATALSASDSPPAHPRRRALIIGLTVTGVALVAAAVGVTLGLTLGDASPSYTQATFGAHPGTQ